MQCVFIGMTVIMLTQMSTAQFNGLQKNRKCFFRQVIEAPDRIVL